MKPVAVIVDAFSAGNLLAPELNLRGYSVLHVRSQTDNAPYLERSFRAGDFEQEIFAPGANPLQLAARLAPFAPRCVIAGCETGVELADALAECLNLRGNGTAQSAARRDKFEMGEAVRSAGLASAAQIRARNWPELQQFVESLPERQLVLKPARSAGTDLVFLVSNLAEAERAFFRILKQRTRFGGKSDAVLAQAYLRGSEYCVNSVSCNGEHRITDIWRYGLCRANGAPFVSDYEDLLDPADPQAQVLATYAKRVLDALGVRFGPAHTEIIWTARGPVLVEMGARLVGGGIAAVVPACLGWDPVELTIDAFCEPARFAALNQNIPAQLAHARMVSLVSPRTGRLLALPRFAELERLRSFWFALIGVNPGDLLERTIDNFSCPGRVALIHTDPEVIAQDHARIRTLEQQGFYVCKDADEADESQAQPQR